MLIVYILLLLFLEKPIDFHLEGSRQDVRSSDMLDNGSQAFQLVTRSDKDRIIVYQVDM